MLCCFSVATANAWTPGDSDPDAITGLAVDRFDRQDVLAFYNCTYRASEDYASKLNWTGDLDGCIAGTTGADFKDDVLRRVNYYRAMTGLAGDVTFNATYSQKSQEAALMMAAEQDLSHTPGTGWSCYSADGAEGAINSNLALGSYGPEAVDQYIFDAGANNTVVGHRRWILYSRAQVMGTGDIPATTGKSASNSLWVIGSFSEAPTPEYVAWPNDGYVPVDLVPDRWSLGYPDANFDTATVTMTQNGTNVPLDIIHRTSGAGDNTIVWEPTGIPTSITSDTPYIVTVNNITGSGPTSKTYTVTLMDPNDLGDSVTVEGTSTPPYTGQVYTFNSIGQASSYELEISSKDSSNWTEGAEDPSSNITDNTSSALTLRQTGLKRTGSKAFQLAYPSGVFDDQNFTVTRNVIPEGSSKLEFYQRGRFATTSTTLEAQISIDSGDTWTSVWTRNGAGLSSNLWDSTWIKESIDVSAYQDETIHIRFIMENNGLGVVQDTSSNSGFFIDDITVTDSSYLTNSAVTTLSSSATSFTLNSSTAGQSLNIGDVLVMRVRPEVGCRWFSFGEAKEVAVSDLSGYDAWVADNFPSVNGGFSGDDDHDGIPNGVEYAFGLDPLTPNSGVGLARATIVNGNLQVSYTSPAGITDITYGADWSDDLDSWNPITDTGSGSDHEFKKSTTGEDRIFMRHNIIRTP